MNIMFILFSRIVSLVTSYRSSTETSANKFTAELQNTLRYLKNLVETTKPNKL